MIACDAKSGEIDPMPKYRRWKIPNVKRAERTNFLARILAKVPNVIKTKVCGKRGETVRGC